MAVTLYSKDHAHRTVKMYTGGNDCVIIAAYAMAAIRFSILDADMVLMGANKGNKNMPEELPYRIYAPHESLVYTNHFKLNPNLVACGTEDRAPPVLV